MLLKIVYKLIDGAHFFIPGDDAEKAWGLCAAHKDLQIAAEDVTHQLNILLWSNHGITTDFKMVLSSSELESYLAGKEDGIVEWETK